MVQSLVTVPPGEVTSWYVAMSRPCVGGDIMLQNWIQESDLAGGFALNAFSREPVYLHESFLNASESSSPRSAFRPHIVKVPPPNIVTIKLPAYDTLGDTLKSHPNQSTVPNPQTGTSNLIVSKISHMLSLMLTYPSHLVSLLLGGTCFWLTGSFSLCFETYKTYGCIDNFPFFL